MKKTISFVVLMAAFVISSCNAQKSVDPTGNTIPVGSDLTIDPDTTVKSDSDTTHTLPDTLMKNNH